MTKQCNICKKIKLFSEFYRCNRGKVDKAGGYRYICKSCDNKLSIKKRKDNGWKNEKKRQGLGSRHNELSKLNSREHRKKMSPMYIRSLMTKKSEYLNSDDVTDEMVEIHTLNLKLKRELKLTPKLKEGED